MVFANLIKGKWFVELFDKADVFINGMYKKKNEPLYQFILDYSKEHKILVSNLDLLVHGHIKNYNDIIYIYDLDPGNVANGIFKLLCSKGRGYSLNIELANFYYSINYETSIIIKISKIKQYKNVSLVDFISPIIVDSIYLLPPILELIDLYKKNYNPEYVDDWVQINEYITAIKNITNTRLKKIIDGGGSDRGGSDRGSDRGDSDKINCIDCKENRHKYVVHIKDTIIDFLGTYNDYILTSTPSENRSICLISQNDIQVDFERLNNFLSNVFESNISMIYKKKNLFIAKDMRIVKHTFLITIAKYGNKWSSVKKPFLDIYNNASYELIPYTLTNINGKEIKLAHGLVQKRFYYMEIWSILAASSLKIINDETKVKYIKEIFEIMIKMPDDDAPKLFFGTYLNEMRSYKQDVLKNSSGRMFC